MLDANLHSVFILDEYKVNLNNKFGDINNNEVKLELKPEVKPVFRIKLNLYSINRYTDYKVNLNDKLGDINNYEVKLELKHEVKPVFRIS